VGLGFGVLGLGYWAKPQIPNPQSPIPNPHAFLINYNLNKINFKK
jgi:hypothetical protein